jgi:phosphoribosylformimino-5-aminoimidazole carboxamide ribotide isomerase
MSRLVLSPAIDLRGGQVVRLTEGRADRETRYASDPAAVARDFEAQGAERLHVVDLDGAIDGRPQTEVVAAVLKAVRLPVEIGGGIRTIDGAARYLELGAERVIFGTAALRDPALVQEAVRRFGAAAVAVGLDAKDGKVAVRGWQDVSDVLAVDLARQIATWGVTRLQYTDVSRDGTLVGPNLSATAEVARTSGLKVTAAGGVSRLEDLRALAALVDIGVDEAIIGKALYERRFTLGEALAAVAAVAAEAR